jgi:LmbE family N-acetylglucosaminyl deacetylase
MDFAKILKPFSLLFPSSKISIKKSAPLTIMLLSPHPDDECITGSLALRLGKENHAHVINVAVTLGSNKERQLARKNELEKACEVLEFENIILNENWKTKEKELKSLILKYQPQIILAPHVKDVHPTHIRTGELCKKVLKALPKYSCLLLWTEFWGQMSKPNLLLEVPEEILALQMQALVMHAGEISRNPYHSRLPAWMMDNVRRGSEIIGGQGGEANSMAFGVLYQLQIYQNGKFRTKKLDYTFLDAEKDLGQMFRLILEAASGSRTKVK